jgi:hypothetical protein
MKHPQRLLPLLVLLAGLAGFLPARADDDASHKAAADELLQVMHTERMIDRGVDQMSQIADRMPLGRTSATPAEETAFREGQRQQARDIIKEQLSWQALEPMFAQAYADAFSEAELKQLTEFYKTPVGEKLLDKQPELAAKLAQITRQKAAAVSPIVMQKLKASIAKFHEDHPVKPVSPAPGVAPGAPAVPGAPGASPASSGLPVPAPVMPPPAASATPSPTPVPTAAGK